MIFFQSSGMFLRAFTEGVLAGEEHVKSRMQRGRIEAGAQGQPGPVGHSGV